MFLNAKANRPATLRLRSSGFSRGQARRLLGREPSSCLASAKLGGDRLKLSYFASQMLDFRFRRIKPRPDALAPSAARFAGF
jgi:hypothetical protein